MFFIYVLRISEKDLNADQTFIVDCLNNKDNRCFPLKMTRSIRVVEDEGEDRKKINITFVVNIICLIGIYIYMYIYVYSFI